MDGAGMAKLPDGWEVVRLGDASINITDGSHFSPKDDKNGDYRIGTVANMTENRIDIDSCKKISKQDYEMLVKNGCKPKKGDVLFSKDGTVGLSFPFKQSDDIVLLSSIAIISPKENLDSDYCACVLKSPFVFKQIEGSKRGTGLRRIILHDLNRFQIPLPPLPEQRRIAEILGTVDNAIQKVGGAIESTERLKKGLMQRLLTRGIGHERFKFSKEFSTEIPEEWDVVKLEDVTGHVGSGLTPRGGALTYLDHGIPLIRSQNVLMNKLDLSDVAYISKETHKYMVRSVVFSGDLLLNITGASIGRVAIIPKSVSEANVNQHVCCIRFSEVIIPIFASYYLSSANGQNQIMSFQSGATRQGLNYQQVKAILIPLPPIPEQRRIAEILSAVDRKLELERRRKEKLERVKKGLMNELLAGRKRVKVY